MFVDSNLIPGWSSADRQVHTDRCTQTGEAWVRRLSDVSSCLSVMSFPVCV